MKLDFNAIAQGYSVDIVSEFLERNGIYNYLVEIGGEIYAKGLNPKGEIWIIEFSKSCISSLAHLYGGLPCLVT